MATTQNKTATRITHAKLPFANPAITHHCDETWGLSALQVLSSIRASENGDQQMNVYIDGQLKHSSSIATGRDGYETPTGSYRP